MTDTQHFAKLIKDIQFAMLTSVDRQSGSLRCRPMTLQQIEFDGDLWFFTGRDSPWIEDIGENPQVNLGFSNVDDNSYVSASGRAELIEDKEKAEELWSPIYKAWFPEGLDDPNLVLLKVRVDHADYWEAPSSKVVQLVGFAKAIATGKRAADIGDHGHLKM